MPAYELKEASVNRTDRPALEAAVIVDFLSGEKPFGFNPDFLREMFSLMNSYRLTPDPNKIYDEWGSKIRGTLSVNVEGEAYRVRGEDVFVVRRSPDCGPNEFRYEEVYIGKLRDVAVGKYVFYNREQVGDGSYTEAAHDEILYSSTPVYDVQYGWDGEVGGSAGGACPAPSSSDSAGTCGADGPGS